MPTVTDRVAATTANALATKKFNVIPPGGAVLNLWASGVTKTDAVGLSVGDREIIVQGSPCNVETAVDTLDLTRDQMVFNEIVGPGELFMPVTVTTEMQYRLQITYL